MSNLANIVERLKNGERLVVSDRTMDALEGLDDHFVKNLRSVPNPDRVGLLDKWIAYMDPVTLQDAIKAMQNLLSWFHLDLSARPLVASELLKDGCPNELKVAIALCLGVIARSTLIKEA